MDVFTFVLQLSLHNATVTIAVPGTRIDNNLLASLKTLVVLLHQSIREGPLL